MSQWLASMWMVQERALADMDLRAGTKVTLGWATQDGHLLVEAT